MFVERTSEIAFEKLMLAYSFSKEPANEFEVFKVKVVYIRRGIDSVEIAGTDTEQCIAWIEDFA